MEGFFRRLLRVDLSNQSWAWETIPGDLIEDYLGGKGMGTLLLTREASPGVTYRDPQNPVIFSNGCFADLPIYGSSRYGIFTKSAQTGGYLECYGGGKTAVLLSRTGNDAIIIKGRSSHPVFLEISHEGVLFRDGSPIWGLPTDQSLKTILKEGEEPRATALVIGPAGEAEVKFSMVINEGGRSFGRGGLGAVWGSKMLKGVVFHGTKRRKAADLSSLKTLYEHMRKEGQGRELTRMFRTYGSPMMVGIINTMRAFPTRYWEEGAVEGWERLTGEHLKKTCQLRSTACPHCFLACGKRTRVKRGPYKGLTISGPDYQTVAAFGGLCLINSLEEIIKVNDVCNRLGLDTVSAGNVVAFAMKASQDGRLNLNLRFGDTKRTEELLHKIAYRDGLGGILAEGIREASHTLGLEDLAIHVKGLELPGFDPRSLKGMGLAYAISQRGATHLQSLFYLDEIKKEPKTGGDARERVRALVEAEDRMTLFDMLLICKFYGSYLRWTDIIDLIEAVTGRRFREEELLERASKVLNLSMAFNRQEGISVEEDTLPVKFLERGGRNGTCLPPEELEIMVAEYHRLRGW
ncbi:MAG: aldehyde ferredoxin oxidoreductase family protein [Deltaproteobacteria bacterium]|nr:aldehyde ferredoxin oxidoreductase family protein [Deltaproteobacteria bacterium]